MSSQPLSRFSRTFSSISKATLRPSGIVTVLSAGHTITGAPKLVTGLTDLTAFENWLLDCGELTAALDDEGSRRYIAMTCHTDNPEAEKAYLHFVENVEPLLKPRQFRRVELFRLFPGVLRQPFGELVMPRPDGAGVDVAYCQPVRPGRAGPVGPAERGHETLAQVHGHSGEILVEHGAGIAFGTPDG